MIGVGVAGHQGTVSVTANLSFASAFLAVTDIVSGRSVVWDVVLLYLSIPHLIQIFAYAGHVAFFTFIAEMKQPSDFPKALYALQVADTTLYLIVGIVVYAYTGEHTVSPALGNTGTVLRKVAYGIAFPTIIIAGVINGHVCAKLIFVRMYVSFVALYCSFIGSDIATLQIPEEGPPLAAHGLPYLDGMADMDWHLLRYLDVGIHHR